MKSRSSKDMHLPLSQTSTGFVADHVRDIPRSGIRDFFEIVQSMQGVISLGIGEPDFVTPWHIREAAIYALERGKTGYTSNLGLLRLREAISDYVASDYHLTYDPSSEILITVGVSEALDLALRAILNPGDEVLYHEPCYVSYSPSIALAHGKAVAIGTDEKNEFKLRPDALRAAITPKSKALLMNFPCNPTGGVMTADELEEIAAICREHNLLVITDEIYSELSYSDTHTSIASLPGMRERTIFLHGFSNVIRRARPFAAYQIAQLGFRQVGAEYHAEIRRVADPREHPVDARAVGRAAGGADAFRDRKGVTCGRGP